MPPEKLESLLVALCAVIMEANKTIDVKRVTVAYNLVAGTDTTFNAIYHQFRPLMRRARPIVEALKSGGNVSLSPATPKNSGKDAPKANRSGKKAINRVQSGRVTKPKAKRTQNAHATDEQSDNVSNEEPNHAASDEESLDEKRIIEKETPEEIAQELRDEVAGDAKSSFAEQDGGTLAEI